MRELKFKMWNKEENKMYEVGQIDFQKEQAYMTNWWASTQSFFPFSMIELLQYTGVKDINKKEIYEGDIVKVNNEIIAKVVWDKEDLGYFLYTNEENSIDTFENGVQPLYAYSDSIEVIGNIYENSKLLEERRL